MVISINIQKSCLIEYPRVYNMIMNGVYSMLFKCLFCGKRYWTNKGRITCNCKGEIFEKKNITLTNFTFSGAKKNPNVYELRKQPSSTVSNNLTSSDAIYDDCSSNTYEYHSHSSEHNCNDHSSSHSHTNDTSDCSSSDCSSSDCSSSCD